MLVIRIGYACPALNKFITVSLTFIRFADDFNEVRTMGIQTFSFDDWHKIFIG